MDIDRFITTDDAQKHALQELTCALCHKVPTNPVTCPSRHYFCQGCIDRHLETSSACPVDDEALEAGQPRSCRFHAAMLAMFKIRCDNRRHTVATSKFSRNGTDCPWVGAMPDLAKHQAECPFRSISCSACGTSVLATFLSAHLQRCPRKLGKCQLCDAVMANAKLQVHYDECPAASVYCPNHCVVRPNVGDALVLRRCDVRAHLKVCPNRVFRCEFAQMGCKFRGNLEQMEGHKKESVHKHLTLITKSHSKLVAALNLLDVTLSPDDLDEEGVNEESESVDRVGDQPLPRLTATSSGSARQSNSAGTAPGASDGSSSPPGGNRVGGTKRRRFGSFNHDEHTGTDLAKSGFPNTAGVNTSNACDSTDVDPASPGAEYRNRSEGRTVRRRVSSDWNEDPDTNELAE